MNFNGKIITALNMYGKSTQDGSPTPDNPIDIVSVTNPVVTLTGKNLFDERTIYEGYYNASSPYGLFSGSAYRTVILNLPAGSYTISTTLENCYFLRIFKDGTSSDIKATRSSYSFSTTTYGAVMICFRNTSSTEITEDFTVQIEEGASATDYEEYVGETYTISKNVFDEETIYSTYSNGDGTFTATRGQFYAIQPTVPSSLINKVVTFSVYADLSSATGDTYSRIFAKVNGTTIAGDSLYEGNEGYIRVTFVPLTENDYVGITQSGNSTTSMTLSQCQLEVGSVRTDYVSYSNSPEPTLRAIPCTSGGNFTDSNGQMWYADEWDIVNGTITRYCQEVTLDGSNGSYLGNYNSYSGYYFNTTAIATMLTQNYGVGYCSHLTAKSTMSGDVGVAFGVSNTNIYFPYMKTATDTSSISTFLTWLASNNMTIVYPLAETTEESV